MSEAGMNNPTAAEDLLSQESQEVPSQTMPRPGVQLAEHRKSFGWSIEQVADQLKLAPRQVQAIEDDNYAALPGMAVTRGFIRAYAKVLRVDATPLLALMTVDVIAPRDERPLRRAVPTAFSEARLPLMSRQGLQSKWSLGVIALGVLLVAALAAQRMAWIPDLSEFVRAKTEKNAFSASQSGMLLTQTLPTPGASASAATVVDAEEKIHPVEQKTVLAPAPLVAPVPIPAPAVAVATTEIVPATKNSLVLTLNQDSWIEVKRADSSTMISRLVKAGATESFDIAEPVQLTVGNVAGVTVTFRGAALDIKSGTRNNVARINLK